MSNHNPYEVRAANGRFEGQPRNLNPRWISAMEAIERRSQLGLWGKMSTQLHQAARKAGLAGRGWSVLAAWSSLLANGRGRVDIWEVAVLDDCSYTTARAATANLVQLGLLIDHGLEGEPYGKHFYELALGELAGPRERQPSFGNAETPTLLEEDLKPPLPPLKGGRLGRPSAERTKRSSSPAGPPQKHHEPVVAEKTEAQEVKQELNEARKTNTEWLQAKQDARERLCEQARVERADEARSEAAVDGRCPPWWPLLVAEQTPKLRAILRQCEIRSVDDQLQLVCPALFRRIIDYSHDSLEEAIGRLGLSGGLKLVFGQVDPRKTLEPDPECLDSVSPSREAIVRVALDQLGWDTPPSAELSPTTNLVLRYVSIDGQMELAGQVLDLAQRATSRRRSLRDVLEHWSSYSLKAIQRLVKFEKRKAAKGDPVRAPWAWSTRALSGIAEHLSSAGRF